MAGIGCLHEEWTGEHLRILSMKTFENAKWDGISNGDMEPCKPFYQRQIK